MESKHQQFPRLSSKETLILELLTTKGPMYGLQLVSGSRGQLKRGTVYVTLGRMEQKGIISSDSERLSDNSGLVPRQIYRPTAFGVRVLDIWKRLGRELTLEFAQ